MLLSCRVFSVTLGPRVIFSVPFVSIAWYSLLLKYIYFSMTYQSIARLFFSISISHCRLAILFFSSLRWFSNIPLLAANVSMDAVPPCVGFERGLSAALATMHC
jgi:hypothetical protein